MTLVIADLVDINVTSTKNANLDHVFVKMDFQIVGQVVWILIMTPIIVVCVENLVV